MNVYEVSRVEPHFDGLWVTNERLPCMDVQFISPDASRLSQFLIFPLNLTRHYSTIRRILADHLI